MANAGAGNTHDALADLERAFNDRSDSVAILAVYPPLARLRDDPRFRSLIQRVGLP
jgi:hypothetical protein